MRFRVAGKENVMEGQSKAAVSERLRNALVLLLPVTLCVSFSTSARRCCSSPQNYNCDENNYTLQVVVRCSKYSSTGLSNNSKHEARRRIFTFSNNGM